MSDGDRALLWVDAQAGGGRVEIYSREVSTADALRMFASASSDSRAFEAEEQQVSFALVHACDASSKHFGADAGVLERALRPENLAQLAATLDAEIATLVHDLPELTKDAEAVREKHASVQAALADGLAKVIADGKIKSH